MISEKTIISGTEEELLAYFKEKYNLIEKEVQEVASISDKSEQASAISDPHKDGNYSNIPAPVAQKGTTGIGNLFGGTSWGQ